MSVRRVNLPVPTQEYNIRDQSQVRRVMEIEIQATNNDIARNELKKTKEGTLALRRFQFMLMGAPNG